MAKYTIELRTLISIGYELDLKTYPIFDESYRTQLNDKIINHYYFHEIGTETPDRFNFYLKQKMNEIMPLYNQLYKNKLNEIVNFKSDDYTKTTQYDGEDSSNRTGSVTTTNDLTTNSTQHSEGIGNSTSTATNTDINSDTPQSQLNMYAIPIQTAVELDSKYKMPNSSVTNFNNDTAALINFAGDINFCVNKCDEESARKIDTFFTMFGYAVNRMYGGSEITTDINRRYEERKSCYIKATDMTITPLNNSHGSDVSYPVQPKGVNGINIEEIKRLFANGLRFWSTDEIDTFMGVYN